MVESAKESGRRRVEFCCARGGSSTEMSLSKASRKHLEVQDIFSGIRPGLLDLRETPACIKHTPYQHDEDRIEFQDPGKDMRRSDCVDNAISRRSICLISKEHAYSNIPGLVRSHPPSTERLVPAFHWSLAAAPLALSTRRSNESVAIPSLQARCL